MPTNAQPGKRKEKNDSAGKEGNGRTGLGVSADRSSEET